MIIENNKTFDPHPATDEPIRAVIVDITEPKTVETKFGPKQKFAIVFETELKKEDGTHWVHWDHGYTPSMDEKSNLRKNLVKILGTSEIPVPFDTESLIGKPVRLIIEHKFHEGKTFANISYYGADKTGEPMRPSGKYVRQRDKDKTDTGSSYAKAAAAPEEKADWRQTKVHVGKFTGQHIEDLDGTAIEALITHWLPTVTAQGAKPTADDRRLITALTEARKIMSAPVEVNF